MKRTLVFGASLKPHRYSYIAIRRLVDAGVDCIFVDTAHGHSVKVLETVTALKKSLFQLKPDNQFYEVST